MGAPGVFISENLSLDLSRGRHRPISRNREHEKGRQFERKGRRRNYKMKTRLKE
jgi:ABC-type uncharacterized transport system ATPase component